MDKRCFPEIFGVKHLLFYDFALSTSDFLIVNALYHENPISQYLRPRLKWLADIGVAEHIGQNRSVLSHQLSSKNDAI